MPFQMQININSGDPGGPAKFDPSPLNVQVGDQIFWTNNDCRPHWPGRKNQDGSIDKSFFMPYQIAAVSDMGPSSSPIFSPGVKETLVYVCSIHCTAGQPCDESGTIVVT